MRQPKVRKMKKVEPKMQRGKGGMKKGGKGKGKVAKAKMPFGTMKQPGTRKATSVKKSRKKS
jgi:hypothetical protein